MPEDLEQVDGQIQDPAEDPPAQNTPDEGATDSPPAQPKEDWQAKAREYEAKQARLEERNRYLEQQSQLLERFALQNRQQPPTQEPSLSAEQAELDRLLDPVISRRFKNQLDPLGQQQAQIIDSNDAVKFELYLMRNNKEVLENEDSYARVMQGVEQIRQQAAQVYGKYLTRVDAYLYLKGMEGVKQAGEGRQVKRQAQVTEEAKRQLQKQAAQSGEGIADSRKPANADIDAIRRRMMAGEKLTPDEKAAFRKHLANAKF